MDHPVLRASIRLRPELVSRDPNQRHTNCCVSYTSGLAGGGFRDMLLIGFNHRGLGEGGLPPARVRWVGCCIMRSPRSVSLVSADPDIDPLVEENMLDDPADIMRMRDLVRRLAVLSAEPAMQAIADRISFCETGLGMEEAAALPTDELDALMLAEAADCQHAAGSCRMSAYEDPRGVVDPDLG